MVPLGRELVSSHQLSMQITLVSGTITAYITRVMYAVVPFGRNLRSMLCLGFPCNSQFGGRMGSAIDPLSSPGRTYYGLALTAFAVLRIFQSRRTDRQTDGTDGRTELD